MFGNYNTSSQETINTHRNDGLIVGDNVGAVVGTSVSEISSVGDLDRRGELV